MSSSVSGHTPTACRSSARPIHRVAPGAASASATAGPGRWAGPRTPARSATASSAPSTPRRAGRARSPSPRRPGAGCAEISPAPASPRSTSPTSERDDRDAGGRGQPGQLAPDDAVRTPPPRTTCDHPEDLERRRSRDGRRVDHTVGDARRASRALSGWAVTHAGRGVLDRPDRRDSRAAPSASDHDRRDDRAPARATAAGRRGSRSPRTWSAPARWPRPHPEPAPPRLPSGGRATWPTCRPKNMTASTTPAARNSRPSRCPGRWNST